MSAIERTLAIIKPDAVAQGHAGQIIAAIEEAGFRILGLKKLHLSTPQAQAFYAVHRERPFFPSLISFMTEGPVIVLALEKENAIADWRDLMGPTNPAQAPPGTIRRRFGSNIERNATHGSDAAATAAFEVGFFFSGAELL